jgi:hypothetical protein
VRPCRRPARPQWQALRAAGLARRGNVVVLCCVVLYATCPSFHRSPPVPTSSAVRAILQRGRCMPHPPDHGPTTPTYAACGAGVPGGPGRIPLRSHALPNMGSRRGRRRREYRATVAARGQTCGLPVPWRGPRPGALGPRARRVSWVCVCSAPSLLCLRICSFILAFLVLLCLPSALGG